MSKDFTIQEYGHFDSNTRTGTGSGPVHNIVICEFLSGYMAACQFMAISHGLDSIAEEAMRESGYTEKEFLKVQKLSGYETRKMNSIIRSAFSR